MLVAVRTQPEHTVQELDRLHDVFDEVSKNFSNQVSASARDAKYQSLASKQVVVSKVSLLTLSARACVCV